LADDERSHDSISRIPRMNVTRNAINCLSARQSIVADLAFPPDRIAYSRYHRRPATPTLEMGESVASHCAGSCSRKELKAYTHARASILTGYPGPARRPRNVRFVSVPSTSEFRTARRTDRARFTAILCTVPAIAANQTIDFYEIGDFAYIAIQSIIFLRQIFHRLIRLRKLYKYCMINCDIYLIL